jgi:hypothetical protein
VGLFSGPPDSEGLLGRGGGSTASLLSWRNGNVFDLSCAIFDGSEVSFCSRSRKASIPSVLDSFLAGRGGGGIGAPMPGFGLAGKPTLRFENVELRDAVDANDVLWFENTPLLLVLLCVAVLLCPNSEPLCLGVCLPLEVLGLRPSKGPGAIVSMRFATFSPPLVRGLSGAYRGSASAYRGLGAASTLSRGLGFALVGVAFPDAGKGGKAQSIFDGRSGEGGLKGRGMGLVALLFILKGDRPLRGDSGERLFGSL